MKIKILILLACLFNLVFLQTQGNLDPNGELTFKESSTPKFTINLSDKRTYYADFIDITLTPNSGPSPAIVVTTDQYCGLNFLYVGTQMVDPVHIFLKIDQIQDVFYICLTEMSNYSKSSYSIKIKNQDNPIIPYNHQLSYYIADKSTTRVGIIFDVDKNENNLTRDSKMTFWAKGKSIRSTDMVGYESKNYGFAHIHYGPYTGQKAELYVVSEVGDYVTVGSTVVNDQKTKEMKENANEILVASDDKVCLPIKFKQDFIPITGKVYTKKAKAYYARSIKEKISYNGKYLETDITNGIIGDLYPIGYLKKEINLEDEGLYCLENYQNKLMIFSIQMTNSNYLQIIYPPLMPGEISKHYLKQNQFSIFLPFQKLL